MKGITVGALKLSQRAFLPVDEYPYLEEIEGFNEVEVNLHFWASCHVFWHIKDDKEDLSQLVYFPPFVG